MATLQLLAGVVPQHPLAIKGIYACNNSIDLQCGKDTRILLHCNHFW